VPVLSRDAFAGGVTPEPVLGQSLQWDGRERRREMLKSMLRDFFLTDCVFTASLRSRSGKPDHVMPINSIE